MNINSIQFENFINKFYSNNSNQKMIININIDSESSNETQADPNIYDIHTMLLDLIIKGIDIFNLDIVDYNSTVEKLQPFFNNINIKIFILNYSKLELIGANSPYINRYIRISSNDQSTTNQSIMTINAAHQSIMTINAAHQIINKLIDIKSFYLIDTVNNLCISFDFIV